MRLSRYYASMPDPSGEDRGRDSAPAKCDLCKRKSLLHSVGATPGQGAFGPQLEVCMPCLLMPVQECVACGARERVPSTSPSQPQTTCHRCRADIQDWLDNQPTREEA